ncbi:MAG TPA: CoA transferase, partial [Afifellaceae bacterium]|nr:CoA transferase [Afifellaceae bacterium]
FLADMGADVIKVEKMDGGDQTRQSVPPAIGGESAAYMMMNRNKRGVALNLKSEDGRAALKRLLLDADVVIENYRLGTMEKFGLGYETLKAENPGLIYCEISGFGRTGPYAGHGGFDLIAQGMSGLMSITGEGQKVDTSLLEAAIIHTYWQSAIAFATGVAPGPMGSAHPLNAPYQAFRTADGWINIGAANQKNWERFLAVIEAPELDEDARFSSNDRRMANLAALVEILTEKLATRPSDEWLARLLEAGVPAGPVLDIRQMHKDAQVIARNMVPETEHPVAGPVKTLGLPVKFSATPGGVTRTAPLLGEHTRPILAEAGYRRDEIERLVEEGAIIAAEAEK